MVARNNTVPLGKSCSLIVNGFVLYSVTDAYRTVVTEEIRATRRGGTVACRLPKARSREIQFTVLTVEEIELLSGLAELRVGETQPLVNVESIMLGEIWDSPLNWRFQAVVFGPEIDEPLATNCSARFTLTEWDPGNV